METVRHRKRSRGLERTFIFLISGLMAFLFFRLYAVVEKDLEEVPKRMAEGRRKPSHAATLPRKPPRSSPRLIATWLLAGPGNA